MQAAHHQVIFVVGGQDDDGDLGVVAAQVADGGDAVHVRHLQVHEDDLGPRLGDKAQTVRPVDSFAHDLDRLRRFKDQPQSLADDEVVVDDHHTDHDSLPTRKWTRVPSLGFESMVSCPPVIRARSRIPNRP